MILSLHKYTLDYYLELARALVACDIHVLCIKDMAGLLTPRSAEEQEERRGDNSLLALWRARHWEAIELLGASGAAASAEAAPRRGRAGKPVGSRSPPSTAIPDRDRRQRECRAAGNRAGR